MRRVPHVLQQRWAAQAAVAIGVALAILAMTSMAAAGPRYFVADELLVGFHPSVNSAKAEAAYAAHGGQKLEEIPRINVHRIRVPEHALAHVEQALSNRSDVLFVERNGLARPEGLTNDPRLSDQWHLFKINAPSAWDLAATSNGVIVAILDSGVDTSHPDLQARVYAGYSAYDGTSNTADVYGHGTKAAGVVAATANNGIGISSVAWNGRIMPIRVTGSDGWASFSALASGTVWATDHGARVMNMSFWYIAGSSTVTSAAKYARSKGALVVASSGNCGCFDDTAPNDAIISVSATGSTDSLASYSSTGNYVDVSAPGSGILTTTVGGGYASVSGTSFSSPVVAGVIALMMSRNPLATPDDIERALKATAVDLGAAGWDPQYGYGRVDAYRAVQAIASVSTPTPEPTTDTIAPSVSVVTPTTGSTVGGSISVQASVSDNVGVTSNELWVDGSLVARSSTARFTVDTTKLTNALHKLTVKAFDAAGNAGSGAVSISVSNITQTDTTPPVVAITSMRATKPKLQVTVSASDNVQVARVELYVDNQRIASSTSAETTFNIKRPRNGTLSISAKAYDTAGNVATSSAVTYVAGN